MCFGCLKENSCFLLLSVVPQQKNYFQLSHLDNDLQIKNKQNLKVKEVLGLGQVLRIALDSTWRAEGTKGIDSGIS